MDNQIKDKISVLMGVYNCEDTVEEAIRCIIDQTYNNWELIICDDGSTDKTFQVCQRLADIDKRICLIQNDKNSGLAYTLNHCFQYANGEFLARMDGDDRCDAKRFEKEINALRENPDASVVSCAMEFYDENGVYGSYIYKERPEKKDIIIQSPFCHAGCMMRNSAFQELGGYSTDAEVERMEDYDLWFRLYKSDRFGINLPDILYSMRDDRNAYRRRKFKHRVHSSKLKWRIYKEFNHDLRHIPCIVLPIIKGILPEKIYMYFHHKKYSA